MADSNSVETVDLTVVDDSIVPEQRAPEGSQPSEVVDDEASLNAMLDQAASELSGEETSEEEAEPKDSKPLKAKDEEAEDDKFKDKSEKASRAQERIRSLNEKYKKEAEDRVAERKEFEARFQQQQQQHQLQLRQFEARQNQYLQQLHQQYQTTLQELQRARGVEEEKTLQPHERWERQILAKADQIAATKTQTLEQRLAAYEQREAQSRKTAERQARFQKWSGMTAEAVDKVLLASVDPEFRGELPKGLEEFLLTYATTFSKLPDQAASEFAKLVNELQRAQLKTRAKKQGGLVKQNQTAPKVGPTSQASADGWKAGKNGQPTPTKELLLANNFKGYWEWAQAGKPKLRSLRT